MSDEYKAGWNDRIDGKAPAKHSHEYLDGFDDAYQSMITNGAGNVGRLP